MSLSDKQCENIHLKFSEQLQLLRSIPSEGYYGRVKGQAYWPGLSFTATDKTTTHGPFNTHDDLLSARYVAAEINTAFSGSSRIGLESYTPEQRPLLSEFKSVFSNCSGREPKFTHLDLNFSNWIVRPFDGTLESASEYAATFIDWGGCGWFPAWVQMASLDFMYTYAFYNEVTGWNEDVHERFLARVAQDLEDPYTEARDLSAKLRESCSVSFY